MIPLAAYTFVQVLFVCLIVIPLACLWVAAIFDIIRSHRSGWGVAGWLLIVCILPVIGALAYFAMRPTKDDPEAAYMAHQDLQREAAGRAGGSGLGNTGLR